MRGNKSKAGFTLAEMIVSVALFSIVVTVSTGALLQVLATNQRAQAIETVMNNLDFALQQMSRDIRVGTNYFCGASASGTNDNNGAACSSFSFTSHDNHRYIYSYSIDAKGSGSIARSIDGAAPFSITSSQINISKLAFIVSGSTPNDSYQPKVLIVLQGSVSVKGASTSFNLQTTVSQRLLDRS